jgi:hypothetical protein
VESGDGMFDVVEITVGPAQLPHQCDQPRQPAGRRASAPSATDALITIS